MRAILLGSAVLFAPLAAQAGDYPFAYRPQAQRMRLVIAAPRADAVQVRTDGRELFVQLDKPLADFDAEAAVAKSDGWLETVQAGYDSVLFRAARPVTTTVERKPTEIVITLAEAPAPPSSAEDGAADRSALRLRTLEAQLTTREGNLGAARQKFETLRTDLPGDAEPTAGLAEVAEQQGRWREARDLYDEAARLAPRNEELPVARDRIDAAHRSFVGVEFEWRKTDGGTVDASGTNNNLRYFAGRATTELQLDDHWRVGLGYDAARVRAGQVGVFSPDTRTTSLNGWARRADLFVRYDDLTGGLWRFELYAAGSVPDGRVPSLTSSPFASFHGAAIGFGAAWSQKYGFGRLGLRGEWHRPNWDFTEGLAQGGTRDRVLLSLDEASFGGVTARGALGFARYGLNGSNDALSKPGLARSVVANADLRTGFGWFGPDWSIGYGFDAEYTLERKLAVFEPPDAAPQTYAPIPPVNREVHVLTLSWTQELLERAQFDRSLLVELSMGPGFDRYGRGGWLANATLTYASGPWRAGLRGGFVSKIGRNGDSVGTLGLSLMRQF